MLQMSPMHWEILYLFILFSVTLITSKLFFVTFNKNSSMSMMKEKSICKSTIWMW